MKNKKRFKTSVMILSSIAVIAAGLVIAYGQIGKNLNELKSMVLSDIDPSSLKDGTYTGSYSAFPVYSEVEVKVKDHYMESIRIIEHRTGKGQPAEAITDFVLKGQSLDVDIVTGATYSSVVILKAIENALQKAQ